MQFKHPEILYALFALLIPIFIHLFQLQRFVKVPFTNVRFLKEIELQTRKSSKLKKRLILMSRMGLFSALIVAFAQPYFSKSDTSKEWQTMVYIDNSLSLEAKNDQGQLLKRASQDILENLPHKGSFTLITNDDFYADLDRDAFKETLMQLDFSNQSPDFNERLLKIQQHVQRYPHVNHKLIVVSDFQKEPNPKSFPSFKNMATDFVILKPSLLKNLAIDSVFVSESTPDYKVLTVKMLNRGADVENVTLNAYQNKIVLAKSSITVAADQTIETQIRISGDLSKVMLSLDYEDTFPFDNHYFLSIQQNKKIAVLTVSDQIGFEEKIFTDDEFQLSRKTIKEVSVNLMKKNQLVVFNEVKDFPVSLIPRLVDYMQNGGSLAFIPHPEMQLSLINNLLRELNVGQLTGVVKDSLQVTKIHFSHPLLRNVFEKEVTNFQYPSVNTTFQGSLKAAMPILSFVNTQNFISEFKGGEGTFYWFSAPISLEYSNFTNSPLIVPIFYNMAKTSMLPAQLSYRLGQSHRIVIPEILQKDEVLTLSNADTHIIPTQEIHTDFVSVFTDEQPETPGFYAVKHKEREVRTLAFNTPVEESNLDYWKQNELTENQKDITFFSSVKEAFQELEAVQNTHTYFKWFLALALLFMLAEIALLKYFK